MIEKVMIFMENRGETFFGVYYESGKTAIFDEYKDLPKTVRIYLAGKIPSNPVYDKYEYTTAFTYA